MESKPTQSRVLKAGEKLVVNEVVRIDHRQTGLRRVCSCSKTEMSSLALLQSLKESILSQANVKAIYGEPIAAHGKTVIPVAKIMYGYGAVAGTGGVGDASARGEGGAAVEEYGLFPWES